MNPVCMLSSFLKRVYNGYFPNEIPAIINGVHLFIRLFISLCLPLEKVKKYLSFVSKVYKNIVFKIQVLNP